MSQAHVDIRRHLILDRLDRPATPVTGGGEPLARDQVAFLLREAKDLYWNELAWEELTDEERVAGGHLTELVFPGFLALVDALLMESDPPGVFATRTPRPEVVEEILLFLAERYSVATVALEQGADSETLVWARAMTAHLIDLVLYKLYRVTPDEREELDSVG